MCCAPDSVRAGASFSHQTHSLMSFRPPSMPSVTTSIMLAVSASQVLYCCANRTDTVLVGIVLPTKAAWAMSPDRPATLIIAKNRAGWITRETSEPAINRRRHDLEAMHGKDEAAHKDGHRRGRYRQRSERCCHIGRKR